MSLRIVMMGTGTFALPTFRALLDSDHSVVGLFTQPDRRGRGHHHHPHPMKELAVKHGVSVHQPVNVNTPDSLQALDSLQADLAVVAAYGQILSHELLAIPRLGAVNLHASLLPRHRGAAPIQYSIWSGDKVTGVCIFQIEPRLDAGHILAKFETEIGAEETSGELQDRLAEGAVPLTLETLVSIESGSIEGERQDPELVTRAPRLKKEDGLIDWSQSSERVDCQVRAMQPWPKAYTFFEHSGEKTRLIVLAVSPVPAESSADAIAPGTVTAVDPQSCLVRTGDGIVSIKRLQAPGKRPMSIQEFLCGHAIEIGDRFVSAHE